MHSRSKKRVRVGSGVWPGLSVGEAVRRRLETEASAPVEEVGRSQKPALFLLGQAFRSKIGSSFWLVV